jgi:REP element-mobilizing transposase RayT
MNETITEPSPLAYLITIRTYGTWLHGDEKGSIDRHGFNTYGAPRMFRSKILKDLVKEEMKEEAVLLDKSQRVCVLNATKEVCDFRGYELLAVNIRTNHLHAVISSIVKPEKITNDIKAYATRRLRENGLIGKEKIVWSRGKSRRYLWTKKHIEIANDYVLLGQGGEIPEFN